MFSQAESFDHERDLQVVPTASAPSAVAAATATATATAAATIFARAGFIDRQGTAVELLAIHRFDRSLGFLIVRHFDEAETLRSARITVRHDAHAIHGSVRLEQRTQVTLGRTEGEISNKNVSHLVSLLKWQDSESGQDRIGG